MKMGACVAIKLMENKAPIQPLALLACMKTKKADVKAQQNETTVINVMGNPVRLEEQDGCKVESWRVESNQPTTNVPEVLTTNSA